MTSALNILILEDNDTDADLIQRELRKAGLSFNSKVVQSREDFEQALYDFSPGLILSDYALPSFDADTAFHIAQEYDANVPFIIISGTIGEENAVKLIKKGVIDYVSKLNLFTLSFKIERALKDVKEREEKLAIADKLKIKTEGLVNANNDLRIFSANLKVQREELQKSNLQLQAEEAKVKEANLALLLLNNELELRVALRTKALSESEGRFRIMMETIPQIAWTNTINGDVVFYNQRWYDYTGFKPGAHQLTKTPEIIHRSDRRSYIKQFSSILSGGIEGEFQIRGRRGDGIYRWHLIRMIPVLDENGLIHLWVGTATDIEELKQLQQHKDDFISIASHELKTPITTLKASLQLLDRLKNNSSAPVFSVLIKKANKNLEKVNTLIEDLLNATMANEGQLQIHHKLFNIRDLIEESCEHVRSDGVYTVTTENVKDFEIYADAIKIEQVIVNFVNNAIKYAPNSMEIVIETEVLDGYLYVSVNDKGKGIEQSKLTNLFDRYYRVSTNETTYNGLGLGLYISSEIIKKHSGEIGVKSELGEGSTFWFSLPINSIPEPAIS